MATRARTYALIISPMQECDSHLLARELRRGFAVSVRIIRARQIDYEASGDLFVLLASRHHSSTTRKSMAFV